MKSTRKSASLGVSVYLIAQRERLPRCTTIFSSTCSQPHDAPPLVAVVLRRVASDGLFSMPARDNDRKTPFNVNSSLAESFPSSPTRPQRLKAMAGPGASSSISSDIDSSARARLLDAPRPAPPMVLRRVQSDALFSKPSLDRGMDRGTLFNVNSSFAESFPSAPHRGE